jgi:hypothetical protein
MNDAINLGDLIAAMKQHNWLALTLVLAVYLRTLFSEKSSFPVNLPPNWRPVISGFLVGGVVTTVTALQAGQSVLSSLLMGLAGLATIGFFDGLLAAAYGKPEAAPTWAKWIVGIIDEVEGHPPVGGAGDRFAIGAQAKPISTVPIPLKSSIPPAPKVATFPPTTLKRALLPWAFCAASIVLCVFAIGDAVTHHPAELRIGMKRDVAVLTESLGGSSAGCSWLKGNSTMVSNDLMVLSECVIAQVLRGVTDPVTIAAGCVGSAISDVEQILASLIDYYTGPQDGGAIGADGMLCGAGDPPFKTAPKCITLAQAGHLHTAHAKAKAALR